jgi:release factor glutamine methyltransferase
MGLSKEELKRTILRDLPFHRFQNVEKVISWYFEDKWKDQQLFSKEESKIIWDDMFALDRGKPLEQISEVTYFLDLKMKVNAHVLIPRPETEELVLWIRQSFQKDAQLKILDVGTGSGCIALGLSQYFTNAWVTAWDVSSEALQIARFNAQQYQLDIQFQEVDILKVKDDKRYDLIVSNPPYVRPSEAHQSVIHEPELALYTPEDDPLLFYRAISLFAEAQLKKGGHLYFELSEFTAQEVSAFVKHLSFQNIEIRKDLSGKQRILRAEKN